MIKPKRPWTVRITGFILVGVALAWVALSILGFMFDRRPATINLLLHDWGKIKFATLQSPDIKRSGKFAIDYTDAGFIEAEGQFLLTAVSGARFEPPPAEWHQRSSFQIKEAHVLVMDIGNHGAKVVSDQDANYLVLESPTGNVELVLEPPFNDVPPALQEDIVYKSDRPVSLSLKPIPVEGHEGRGGSPSILFLAEDSVYFSLNHRPRCETTVFEEFRASTNQRVLNISERCEEESSLTPYLQSMPRISVVPMSSASFDSSLLLLPKFYEANIADFHIANTEDNQIFVLWGDGLTWLEGQSAGEFQMAVVSQPDRSSWFRVQPATHVLEFKGPVGSVKIGTEHYVVDQMDNLKVTFVDWTNIQREHPINADEMEQRVQQPLTIHGKVESVLLNNEELVQTRWKLLPGEVQGVIITLTVTGLFYLVSNLWKRYYKEASPPTTIVTETAHVVFQGQTNFANTPSFLRTSVSSESDSRRLALMALVISAFTLVVVIATKNLQKKR